MVSSSSSLERKKLVNGCVLRVLGEESGCKGSYQLELFKVEMVVVCKGMVLVGKLDLLLCLVLSKGTSVASGSRGSRYEEG